MNRFIVCALAGLLASAPVYAGKPGTCADADRDGYKDAACGGNDCDDASRAINPGAAEVCGDGIDQDCSGGDLVCGPGPVTGGHGAATQASITWSGYGTCGQCHAADVSEVIGGVHYRWQGSAAEMQGGAASQGKMDSATAGASALNAYCINILGNWNGYAGCSACHVGVGNRPGGSADTAANVDCLLCHNDGYVRTRVNGGLFSPAAGLDMTAIARAAKAPTRKACLQCHAKAGGGDALKRGDLALASATTADASYDVHMATSRGNLACQACHKVSGHRFPGRGTDLRPEDTTAEVACTTCHPTKDDPDGHVTAKVNAHVARVACQACHIGTYGKNASDTAATEATETHRDWSVAEFNTALNRYEPTLVKANDLKPRYLFWNGYSWGNNLKEQAVKDTATGYYKISRPLGSVADTSSLPAKLYPFKYKTAYQPLDTTRNVFIAIDTADYFQYGVPSQAVAKGLANMGYAGDASTYATTDEYQLLTHQVSPKEGVVTCGGCHPNASASQGIKLVGQLGYALKGATTTVCAQCHRAKSPTSYDRMHARHVDSVRAECSYCHTFSRPERGLRTDL